jgi:protease-4
VTLRSGIGLVFALIGLAVIVSFSLIALMYLSLSRGPSVPSSASLVLRPDGELPELPSDDVVGQFFGESSDSVRTLVESLQRAKDDPRVTSVLLRPGSLQLPYWAKVQELRDALMDFRESEKPVIAFLEFGGDREYYLASAADEVYLLPSSALDLTGVASYEIFLRGAFDKLGVQPDYLKIGDYKSAPNQMTEKEMTPAHREMTEAITRDTYDRLVKGIAEARELSEDQVRALMDRGPLLASEAVEAKLVDGVAYEDELDDKVSALREDGESVDQLEVDDYRRSRGYASGGFRFGASRPRVAVLYAVGTIVSGRGGFDATDGALVGSDAFVEEIRRIKNDSSIRAVVLRIDSPGGSSVASDVIWRELTLLRKDDPERPLVVSMGDLAASGGYYIATPADEIVAQPSTLTGSIGIFVGKFALGQGLEKLGVTTQVVMAGRNADIYSPFTPFSGEQRTRVQAFLDDFYKGFVAKVADSRKKTPQEIDALAQGRVWTGGQARENGLVDRLGGLDVAIAAAKERAGIDEDDEVEVVVYPRRRNVYEALSDQFGDSGVTGVLSALLGRAPARAVAAATAPSRLFRRGEPLALMPFAFVR